MGGNGMSNPKPGSHAERAIAAETLALGNFHQTRRTLETMSTSDLFITIPEVTLPNGTIVPSFRVGQYVCTQGADGKAAITAEGTPWVRINFDEAQAACIVAGYALITELQWLAIAYDASQQAGNWTKGQVGEGKLFRGIRRWNYQAAQPGNVQPADAKERRWLTLSNGERICDLNGNVYQWVFDDVQGDEQGLVARAFAADSPSLAIAPYFSMKKGMGWRPDAGTDWSGRALIRGGFRDSEAVAGAFDLYGDWPGYRYDNVGFRCTKPIGL
jgi:formylglycine-generating enzyme required for sulfatase activity